MSLFFLLCMALYQSVLTQEQNSTGDFPPPPANVIRETDRSMRINVRLPFMLSSCKDIQEKQYPRVKAIMHDGMEVLCDTQTDGGGWTIIQRRTNGKENFFRNWADYKNGFGSLDDEFWFGLEKMYRLTTIRCYQLRIDMEYKGQSTYAAYSHMKVYSEAEKYTLIVGNYSGTAGDSLNIHNERPFSTKDRDNDRFEGNCAVRFHGAWWYETCHKSNLNGLWTSTEYGEGLNWFSLTGYYDSLTAEEMKIRPCY